MPALFEAADENDPVRVFLLGAAPGLGERAAANIERRWRGVRVVGTYSPPLGFEKSDSENQAILHRIAEATPDVLIVGLGAPKQELWVHKHHGRIQARAALCVGATIDFLAGGGDGYRMLAEEPRISTPISGQLLSQLLIDRVYTSGLITSLVDGRILRY